MLTPIDRNNNVERFAHIAMILKSLTAHTDELHRIAAQAREKSRRQLADPKPLGRRRGRVNRRYLTAR